MAKKGTEPAAMGLRIKSGWAVAVLVSGTSDPPRAVNRTVVQLSDPSDPDSKQPYHVLEELSGLEGEKAVKRLCNLVGRVSRRSVRRLLSDYQARGYRTQAAGLVVGSLVNPDTIKNPHIRFHALEGQLFRNVTRQALLGCRLKCLLYLEKDLFSKAANILQQPEEKIRQRISSMGAGLESPWRAEEKLAALAGWLTLNSFKKIKR